MRPQLKHLGIYVDDIERMERFYTSVFGLVVSDRGVVPRLGNRKIVFLSAAPDAHHQVVLLSGKDPASGPSVVFQMSFHVQTLEQLREIRSRLAREGVTEVSAIDHGNAWSIYASDPEGNGLEAYLDSPWHVAQPHGRPFDLSLPDEKIFANTEAVVRKDPTFAERPAWMGEMRRRLS
ncbi:MAG TPA: VOC family protein [Burkholderiales bacterium]|nr:VOC family protein [Burkholderiales bacterium]